MITRSYKAAIATLRSLTVASAYTTGLPDRGVVGKHGPVFCVRSTQVCGGQVSCLNDGHP